MFHTYNSILFSYSVRAQRYPENRPLGLFKYLGSFLPKFVGAQYAYKIMAQKLGEARAQLALQVASSLSCLKKVHGNSRNYLLNSSCQSLENMIILASPCNMFILISLGRFLMRKLHLNSKNQPERYQNFLLLLIKSLP